MTNDEQANSTQSWVEDGVEIHDHFEGSSNCVQCGGDCRLRGEMRVLTEVIRGMFERWARDYLRGPDPMQRNFLTRGGVRIEECYIRASTAVKEEERRIGGVNGGKRGEL